MSSSDQDFSEGSRSSWSRSPYSSPSQHVPQLANALSGITCEDVSLHSDAGKKRPFLCITEQPQNYFRFRYKSEMVGTHGCLLGKSATTTKNKTHPTVELVNYTGKAIIRCRLSQADKDDEHPHKLFENEQEDLDVSAAVPEQGSYKVSFAGMGIIHTAKKAVPGLLFKKYEYTEMMKNKNVNVKQLRERSENTAKSINLNIVRLKFSAHDAETDEEVCPPVFSEPINNMKSAAVNDLKICRMDRHFGRARGGDDVFLLVEKVNKKNIMIRLFETNEQGEEVWSANGNFLLNDVHHQYAIVFRTPPYRHPDTLRDVKVYIELVRPSDQRTSEPKEFVYKADPILRQNKRRRPNSSYSSMESSSGGSLKSLGELPTTVEMINQDKDQVEGNPNVPVYHIEIPPMPIASTSSNGDLGDALYYTMASESVTITVPPLAAQVAPMLGQPNVPEPPVIQLNSSELERLINPHIPSEERKKFCEADWSEYMLSFGESLSEKTGGSMDFSLIRQSMQLIADGGRAQNHIKEEPIAPPAQSTTSVPEEKRENIADRLKGHNEYNAFYSAEDGNEVKKLVKEICDLIKNKRGYNKQTVRAKLERLFEFKLSNGDAFLHMTLCSNQSSFDFIVRLVHSLRMPHLLNKTNKLHQTILHLAVIYDVPSAVQLLVAKGCDPMLGDDEGSNAVHYAVICQTCLEPLLKAIKHNDVAFDLNAYNQDKQTALHLAAIYDSEQSARLLLQYGASYNVTDNAGRTALHLAAYDGYLTVMRALVAVIPPDDIDAVDGCGNTALQIVCGSGVKAHTIEMIKLLLDKKADPTKHLENNEPAWRMCLNKPALWDTVRPYVPESYHDITDDDIKSEPEDDFESADEGLVIVESENLVELPLYIEELSHILDAHGAWRSLAERTRSNALLACCQAAPSPARALLACLKETGENLTSQSLAMHLQDMGETVAANVVRRYISDK